MNRRGNAIFRRLSLRSQLLLATSTLSIIASLIVGISSFVLQSDALRKQAAELISYRTEQAALNLEHLLDGIYNNTLLLASDTRVQAYLLSSDETSPEAIALLDEVYSLLSYTNSLQYNLAYSYIIKEDTGRVLYLGPSRAQRDLQFDSALDAVSERSKENYYNLAGPYVNPVSGDGAYAFAMYQAIHDIYQVDSRIGVLCLALPEARISSEFSATDNVDLSLCVVDAAGTIISHVDREMILTNLNVAADLEDDVSIVDNTLVVRKQIRNTGWYVVGTMPMGSVLSDKTSLILLVGGMVILTILLCSSVSALLVKEFTKPFNVLRQHLEKVSGGDFTSRIDLDGYGQEYSLIAQGFNTMSERIGLLMEEARRASIMLKDSELRALKAQINPHFLYNTLDSIHWMAAINGEKEISTMVMALANFYRVCLGNAREIIPLSEELKHVTSYLTIQRIRYSDVLESEIEVSEEDLKLQVPSMVLQPLVENAIYHGLKGMDHRGMVRLRIYRAQDNLYIDVEDDGRGMDEDALSRLNASLYNMDTSIEAHGVMNVHRRILLLCGEEYGLLYAKNTKGGIIVRIRLPIKEEGAV